MTWDIVGFPDAFERLHPENALSALGDVVDVYARSIEEFSGRVLNNVGDAGLAFWLHSPLETHALLAFRCGASICKRLSQPKSPDLRPYVRFSLGTGGIAGGLITGRPHIVGVACTTAKRLRELDLPRRTSMLYTSETLAFLEGETPLTAPVARLTRTTGEEVEVYEYCDRSS
jgi:class 3 adenylate cyclase